jgi:hypothetical protein
VVVLGIVVCAGGMVAKSVGPIGTTVVADPLTSTPHAARVNAATAHAATAAPRTRGRHATLVRAMRQG